MLFLAILFKASLSATDPPVSLVAMADAGIAFYSCRVKQLAV